MSSSGTKRMGSWADYERRQSDGSCRSTSAVVPSNAASASKKRSKKRAPPPTGIDSLYVDAPPGIDTRLQFHWMRPHPSSAILAAARAACKKSKDGSNAPPPTISPHVVESARLVEQYRRAKYAKMAEKNSNDDVNRRQSENDAENCSFQPSQPIGISVELTSLFDPPLLSEWIPGVDTDISYVGNNDDDESDKGEDFVEHMVDTKSNPVPNTDEVNAAIDKLVQSASQESLNTETNHESTDDDDDELGRSIRQLFGEMSTDSLVECLPSRTLLQNIQDRSAAANDERPYLAVSITSLTLLATTCPTNPMGRHILSVLAPILLSSERAAAVKDGLSESNARRLHRLSEALVNGCRLGELSKGELLKLADNHGPGAERSEVMEELIIGLGRAYHGWHQNG